jgi:hypothetical protein
MKYDERHGGAYDRGRADAYYQRSFRPHMFVGKTYQSDEINEDSMSPDEIAAYRAGFDDQVETGDHKNWR